MSPRIKTVLFILGGFLLVVGGGVWGLVQIVGLKEKRAMPAPRPTQVSFQVVEVKQMGEAKPTARSVYLVNERPILLIEGAGIVGKEIFVELLYQGKPLTISPSRIGVGGTWYSMGHGDLPPGNYAAQLYLDGKESLVTSFTILK